MSHLSPIRPGPSSKADLDPCRFLVQVYPTSNGLRNGLPCLSSPTHLERGEAHRILSYGLRHRPRGFRGLLPQATDPSRVEDGSILVTLGLQKLNPQAQAAGGSGG